MTTTMRKKMNDRIKARLYFGVDNNNSDVCYLVLSKKVKKKQRILARNRRRISKWDW